MLPESRCSRTPILAIERILCDEEELSEVFFLHALNSICSTKHEDVSITSGNLLHVKYRVRCLIASKERFHFGILVDHLAYDSTLFGSGGTDRSERLTRKPETMPTGSDFPCLRPKPPPSGHLTPAASARCRYSYEVPRPIEQPRAIARSSRPTQISIELLLLSCARTISSRAS